MLCNRLAIGVWWYSHSVEFNFPEVKGKLEIVHEWESSELM